MIGVHGGAPAPKFLDLGVVHEVKKAILQRFFQFFPGVLCIPMAAHGFAPDCKHVIRMI
jgi:hypothetical protein